MSSRPGEEMSDETGLIERAERMIAAKSIPKAVRAMLQELVEAIEELDAHCDNLIEDGVTNGLHLQRLAVENGQTDLSITTSGIAEQTVLVMLDGLADMLGDATNYVEFDLRRRGKTPVSVCVRRYGHPTPHDLRLKAEAERDEALDSLAQLTESP